MKSHLTQFAKELRKESTKAERIVWKELRAKKFNEVKFRRQQPIGKYIVDFVAFSKKIIIELDGSQHIENAENDRVRDEWFKVQGYKVLRFWNNEVFNNLEGVLQKILEAVEGCDSIDREMHV